MVLCGKHERVVCDLDACLYSLVLVKVNVQLNATLSAHSYYLLVWCLPNLVSVTHALLSLWRLALVCVTLMMVVQE